MTNRDAIKYIYDKLKPHQQEMFTQIFKPGRRKVVLHAARRSGKSFTLCSAAIVKCLSGPNKQVRYATFTGKALKKMIFPIFKIILQELPPKIKPHWNGMDGVFTFHNGSQIHLAGVENGHSDDLRGTAADLCIVDEAAFITELGYLIDSVMMPQLLTVADGRLIMASSSPLSPAHEFVDFLIRSKAEGCYSSYDIYSSGYSDELIEEFCKEAGGPDSTTWRREYRNELIVDDTMSIVPEWQDEFVAELPKDPLDKYWHRYESMDLGVRDKTAVLFGKYLFSKAILYVEQVWTCSGQDTTTKHIAESVKRIEGELGYNEVYCRVADNNSLITLNDLNTTFGVYFGATSKDSLAAMVNEVRLWVQSGRLIVHPRCTELIDCLKYGVYQDHKRKEFGRSKALGHYDALASLVYLIRNINIHTNPVPHDINTSAQTHYVPKEQYQDSEVLQIFNMR
jgi:hypothetical protein